MPSIADFVPGHTVRVRDRMQKSYSYTTTYKAGTNLKRGGFILRDGERVKIKHPDFEPYYTPRQMLVMGVFEGKYLNDCTAELPEEWFYAARHKLSGVDGKANPKLNYFGIKSRMSLQEWRKRGWTPVHPKDRDPRGWFQWYCRYWLGRRIPEVDAIQIARWRAFARHYAQVKKNARGKLAARPRQRQALLQWSWRCDV